MRNEQRKRNYHKGADNDWNAGQIYNHYEDELILSKRMFIGGKMQELTDREIAKCIGRTVQAIQEERFRLKHR